jgi:hypothetical protein
VTADDELDGAYAQIPRVDCRGRCQQECTNVDVGPAEAARLRQGGHRVPRRWQAPCPLLGDDGRCEAYELRPVVCRLWGACQALPCPHGCVVHGGPLDDADALRIVAQALQAGGVPVVDEDLISAVMADPQLAGAAAAVLRGMHRR